MPFEVHPKSNTQINQDRRAKSKKGCIDEIEPDGSGRNVHGSSQFGTHPKGLFFDKILQFFHARITFVEQIGST